jgi:hypothetical protein
MWQKWLTIEVLVSFFIFLAPAAAQKNELAGLVGRTFISDQDIVNSNPPDKLYFGDGWTGEANYARLVRPGLYLGLALEVPFAFDPHEDLGLIDTRGARYSSYFVTPSARVNFFSGMAVSPWISAGGGFGYFSTSSGVNFKSGGTATGVFQGGFGLDVKLIHQLSLRGEARDFWSGVPQLDVKTTVSRQHNIFVGAGVVWHF